MESISSSEYVIIGSGFGGSFLAYQLAKAGKEVLVLERGIWAARDDSCWDENILHLPTPLYRGQSPILADQSHGSVDEVWPSATVGGLSTLYGAAAFRLREEDFLGAPLSESAGRDPATAWPLSYPDLEPYYGEAERLQHVAGVQGEDLSDPPRSSGFPQRPPELSPPSKRVWKAAARLGLHPAHIPLAINFDGRGWPEKCVRCSTCDHYICKVQAKGDLAVVVLPEAVALGARVLPNVRVIKINASGARATSVEILDQSAGSSRTIKAANVIVAAGALGSPHLLISSGIRGKGGGADLMGRFLFRHINCVAAGLLPFRTNPRNEFHKQVVIPDYYHGDPSARRKPDGPWGMIQQVHMPGEGVLKAESPKGWKTLTGLARPHLLGLLCIAEDIPQASNRVYPDSATTDRFGQPSLKVFHRYLPRDYRSVEALARVARKILRKAMAVPVHTHSISSFSHALGTCRFGKNRETSVLDPECRVWGFENLYVVDGSFMPSGGSVNPSLTIGANALRVGAVLAEK